MIAACIFCTIIAFLAYSFKHIFYTEHDCIKSTMATYSMGALLLPIIIKNPIDIDRYNVLILFFFCFYTVIWSIAYIDESTTQHSLKNTIAGFNLGPGTTLIYVLLGFISPKTYAIIHFLSQVF